MTNDGPAGWPLPLRLLARLLSPHDVPPRRLAGQMTPADWSRFARLVIDRHRVAPVVAPRLASLPVPPEALSEIQDEVGRNARLTLATMAELRRVLGAFEGAGAVPVVLKGWPLGEQLYGAPAGRHSGDCDLLVPVEAVGACAAALGRLGYRPVEPHRLRGRVAGSPTLALERNEIEFEQIAGEVHMELHWRPHHFAGWPDPLARPGAVVRRPSAIGALSVPADGPNLLYLCMHGALHGWGRLKWLADVARLAERRGAEALAGDLAAARRLGMETAGALALRIAASVHGSPLPPALRQPDRRLDRLAAATLATIARDDWAPGTMRARIDWYLNGVRLGVGLRQKLAVLRYAGWGRLRLLAADLARGGQA